MSSVIFIDCFNDWAYKAKLLISVTDLWIASFNCYLPCFYMYLAIAMANLEVKYGSDSVLTMTIVG